MQHGAHQKPHLCWEALTVLLEAHAVLKRPLVAALEPLIQQWLQVQLNSPQSASEMEGDASTAGGQRPQRSLQDLVHVIHSISCVPRLILGAPVLRLILEAVIAGGVRSALPGLM
jgi:hypothetical protein